MPRQRLIPPVVQEVIGPHVRHPDPHPQYTTDADLAALATTVAAVVLATTPFSAVNKDSVTISKGMAISPHASGTGFIRASGASAGTPAFALVTADVAALAAVDIQFENVLTQADWTAVIGAATLTAKAIYYLDPSTPGRLTATAPTAAGQVVQQVGEAISPTSLKISIFDYILLT